MGESPSGCRDRDAATPGPAMTTISGTRRFSASDNAAMLSVQNTPMPMYVWRHRTFWIKCCTIGGHSVPARIVTAGEDTDGHPAPPREPFGCIRHQWREGGRAAQSEQHTLDQAELPQRRGCARKYVTSAEGNRAQHDCKHDPEAIAKATHQHATDAEADHGKRIRKGCRAARDPEFRLQCRGVRRPPTTCPHRLSSTATPRPQDASMRTRTLLAPPLWRASSPVDCAVTQRLLLLITSPNALLSGVPTWGLRPVCRNGNDREDQPSTPKPAKGRYQRPENAAGAFP